MSKTTELAVALDFDRVSEAEALIEALSGLPVIFKVGLELYTVAGPEWVRSLTASGRRIFLDLKLHDIPNTVTKAVLQIEKMGVEFTTVHLVGGRKMLDQIQRELPVSSSLKVLGISVLTSFSEEEWVSNTEMMAQPGSARGVHQSVMRFAELANEHAAISGMVCSPQEIPAIRKSHSGLFLMVPGIRPEGSEKNDQERVMTPAEASRAGASAIVVGRPITRSIDPRKTAERILQELN